MVEQAGKYEELVMKVLVENERLKIVKPGPVYTVVCVPKSV